MGRSKIFLIFCLAFIAGVGAARFFDLGLLLALGLIFVILISVWWGRRWPVILGFAGLILVLGAVRYQTALPDTSSENFIGQYYGGEITIEGIIVEDPDQRSEKVNLTVRPLPQSLPPTSLSLGEAGRPGEGGLEGKILLNVGRYPEYKYGDKLKISGKLEEPFESEDFSYKNYLSRFGVYGIMRFPQIEKLDEGQGNPVKAALLQVKNKFRSTLSQILPEPHNALVLGLILGLKKAIPEYLNEAFIITGVSHIVVVSGYNISIITRGLLKTRAVMGRRFAFWLSLLVVMGFVVITGAEASVIRASIMGMMLVFALNIGRLYQAANALVFAGAVMIAQSPQILAFDIGFQLSFLATLGLIFLAPVFENWFRRIPNLLQFRSNLSSTLAAQVFTLPLLIYYFDRLSLIAPLVNVLILWAIPYAMFFGFFAGLSGIVFLPLGQILAAPLWVILEFMIRIVEFFARFQFASTSTGITIPIVIGYYAILFWLVFSYRWWKGFWWQVEYVKMKL